MFASDANVIAQLVCEPPDIIKKLLCTINCNLALCYTNIDEYFRYLMSTNVVTQENSIKADVIDNYVKTLICGMETIIKNRVKPLSILIQEIKLLIRM